MEANELKLKGVNKVTGETKSLKGWYSPIYLQLNVDLSTGEIWTNRLCDLGHNSWVEYHDGNIISCGTLTYPMTRVQIREKVYEAINNYYALKRCEAA